jgi:hypothetical protein
MIALTLIIGGVLLRLVPHLPNFAPITGIAIFGGTYLSKKYAVILPFLIIAISDYLLLYISPYKIDFTQIHPISAMFHSTTLYVWGSIIVSGIIGIWLKGHRSFKNFVTASLFASLQFFIVTNFGVWAEGMYNRDLGGLLESYMMGIPFFKWTVLGDLFYTGVFIGAYELAVRVNRKSFLTVT